MVDDKFRVKAQDSSWFILTSQHATTFSKLKLTKTWTGLGPKPNQPNNKDVIEWERSCPAICFGSIYIDEAHRLRRQENPVMKFLREINGWFRFPINPLHGPQSAPYSHMGYVLAKWFMTGTNRQPFLAGL